MFTVQLLFGGDSIEATIVFPLTSLVIFIWSYIRKNLTIKDKNAFVFM
jgi:hypothetical protein